MPQQHSDNFNRLLKGPDPEHLSEKVAPYQFKNPADLATLVIQDSLLPNGDADGNSIYDHLANLLREVNDAQYGIVSTLNENGEWVRDATQSFPIEKRIPSDHPAIEANNALLRCLSRLRPIDYAIEHKHHPHNDKLAEQIRNELKQALAELSTGMLTAGQLDKNDAMMQIKTLEKSFDDKLLMALHQANLTKGIATPKEAEGLLAHYRNLSSLMVPARTMITLTYDKKAKVLQRESQYPVTHKTDEQLKAIQTLTDINPYPVGEDKNAHTTQNLAMQEADALFSQLMGAHDRALPAQTRKTHLVGAKNAFIVKNELLFDIPSDNIPANTDWKGAEDNTIWLARTGVPVYVGKGENEATIQRHTRENLEQIRLEAQQRMGGDLSKMHITTLNTYTPLESQWDMIHHLQQATTGESENQDDLSYVPTNIDGTFRFIDVSKNLYDEEEHRPWGSAPLHKAWRLYTAAEVMLQAVKKGFLSVVNCASGQDRTGTAVEKATQIWMGGRYKAHGLENQSDNIETMRAEGGNAAEMTTHHVHGSPGMKEESQAGNTFSPEASKQLYRKSADTNKKNPVGNVDFLNVPSEEAVNEFLLNQNAFSLHLSQLKQQTPLTIQMAAAIEQGKKILAQVNEITDGAKTVPLIQQHVDSKSLADLNSVMVYCKNAVSLDKDTKAQAENARKLAGLSHAISKKASKPWKALGLALCIFAAVALIAVGILGALPTHGASLMLTLVGGLGLLAAAEEASSLYHSSEKGLASSVGLFKMKTDDLNLVHPIADEKPLDSEEIPPDQPKKT
ncbi:hypothetical protein [Legionella sp. W05-934-2]|uniref:hypothetical protein n=1 Tax=Legionella sp. W05-934-2 TaxID=1198649 RepID=UPI003462B258